MVSRFGLTFTSGYRPVTVSVRWRSMAAKSAANATPRRDGIPLLAHMALFDKKNPVRTIVFVYCLAGGLWTVLSVASIYHFDGPRPVRLLLYLANGWLYTGLSAVLIYYLIRHYFTHLTARKEAELALQASEARYRAVVEDQTEIISRYRPDGTYTFVNEVFCRLFGKTAGELVGSSWHPDVYPDDIPLIEARLREMSHENPVVVIENRVYTATGGVRWMQFVNRGFYDARGELVEIQAVGRDITERKQVEELQRVTKARFAAVFHADLVAIGFSRLDNGHFIDVNAAFLELFGFSREEVLGHSSQELGLWPCPEERQTMLRAIREHGWVRRFEARFRHRSGRIGTLLISAQIIELQGREFLIGMLSDITERKIADEAVKNYARRLIDMDEELRRRLAAELHDEVGPDLTALGLTMSLVREQLPESLRQQLAARFEDAAVTLEAVSQTVRGVMATLWPPVLDDYGLPAALRWYCEQFSKRTGLTVRLTIADDLARFAPERELACFRIAQEALHNAAKYARIDSVQLELVQDAAEVRMTVSDAGVGFDAGQQSQPEAASTWGLTIMKERARAVGGTFNLVTAPGQGARLEVVVGREA